MSTLLADRNPRLLDECLKLYLFSGEDLCELLWRFAAREMLVTKQWIPLDRDQPVNIKHTHTHSVAVETFWIKIFRQEQCRARISSNRNSNPSIRETMLRRSQWSQNTRQKYHRMGTLIYPVAKAIASITDGVNIIEKEHLIYPSAKSADKIMERSSIICRINIFIAFFPFRSFLLAACQQLRF